MAFSRSRLGSGSWLVALGLLAIGGGVAWFTFRSDRPETAPLATTDKAEKTVAGRESATTRDVASNSLFPGSEPTAPPPEPIEGPTELVESERELLWEIEHLGLSLGKYGFKPWAAALKKADREALLALLAEGFRGETLGASGELVREAGLVQVARRRADVAPSETVDRERFVEMLLEARAGFGVEPQVKFSLMGLAPVDRKDLDQPWRGTCLLRIWGEYEPGRPSEFAMNLEYEVPRPTKENLAQPGWLKSCKVTYQQVSRSPEVLMREVAAERGVKTDGMWDNWKCGDNVTITGGVFLCDFNRDGYMDMLVTDLPGPTLYQGGPNAQLRDVTEAAGLAEPDSQKRREDPKYRSRRDTATFIDIDGDGWEDLILGDTVFRNEEGKRFLDYRDVAHLIVPTEASGAIVADYDRDGRLDLYFTVPGRGKEDSWLNGKSGGRVTNQLWRNLGNWIFENVTEKSGTKGGYRSTFSSVWFDANNDQWPDLYVINEFGNGVLLVNRQDGTFREVAFTLDPADYGSMGVTAGDIDNDGDIDLYVGNMYSKAGSRVIGNLLDDAYPERVMRLIRTFPQGSQMWVNGGNEKFEGHGKQMQVANVGWAYGPAFVDLDSDGFLDLYATCGFISKDRNEPDG